jgi:hypothetical protein
VNESNSFRTSLSFLCDVPSLLLATSEAMGASQSEGKGEEEGIPERGRQWDKSVRNSICRTVNGGSRSKNNGGRTSGVNEEGLTTMINLISS